MSSIPDEVTADERRVLTLLQERTYEQVREETGWSRGRIYALALRTGARKHEHRIRERAAERRRRQEEFLEEMRGRTVLADVLDFLEGIPDDTADLVLTSPPYNLGRRYSDAPGADSLRFLRYHGWLMEVISEAARILKPGGTLFLQVGFTRDDAGHRYPLDCLLFPDLREAGLTFQNRVVWKLTQGVPVDARLVGLHETALVFSKAPQQTFNPGAARIPQNQPGKRAYKGPNAGALSGHPLGAHPVDVWDDIPTVRNGHPEATGHPAQFPEAIAMRAILLYTLPGESLVVDPFSGSGTTHVCCVRAGRSFIGADLDYAAVRDRRLAAATPDLSSPLTGVTDESVAVWQAEARRVDAPASGVRPDPELLLDFMITAA